MGSVTWILFAVLFSPPRSIFRIEWQAEISQKIIPSQQPANIIGHFLEMAEEKNPCKIWLYGCFSFSFLYLDIHSQFVFFSYFLSWGKGPMDVWRFEEILVVIELLSSTLNLRLPCWIGFSIYRSYSLLYDNSQVELLTITGFLNIINRQTLICAVNQEAEESFKKIVEVDRLIDTMRDANGNEVSRCCFVVTIEIFLFHWPKCFCYQKNKNKNKMLLLYVIHLFILLVM